MYGMTPDGMAPYATPLETSSGSTPAPSGGGASRFTLMGLRSLFFLLGVLHA
jgi:hypothetical protein